jgi:hypothetical protein
MKPATLVILAVATVLLALGTVWIDSRAPVYRSGTGGALVFPDLATEINDAAKLTVETADQKVTVERKGEGWVVADKYDYPAKFDLVKQELVGLAQLKTVEAKTAEPSLYARLEVEDVSQKGAKGELLTLEDAKGGKLAGLILGKRHYARGADQAVEIYVRKPTEAQSWLATGTLDRNDDPKQWLKRDVVDLERERLSQVTVTPAEGKPFTLSREKPGDGDFTLDGVPPEDKAKAAYELNAVTGALAALLLDDVLPATALKPEAKLLRRLEYKSFDGLVVELALYEQDGRKWLRIKAAYDPEGAIGPPSTGPAAAKTPEASAAEAPEAKLKSADEVKKEVETINARGQDWAFGLAASDLVNLEKNFSDLIEPKDKPKS